MIPKITLSNVSFPSDDINPKKRGKEWYLQMAQAAYTHGSGKFSHGPYASERRDQMETLRKYGAGEQDESQYEELFFGSLNTEGMDTADLKRLRKGMANLNWSIFSVAPKFMNVLKGKFEDLHLTLDAQAIDEKSLDEKTGKKYKMLAEMENAKWVKPLEPIMGRKLMQDRDWMPGNREELEMYETVGGFKLRLETSIEKILKAGFELSSWDNDLKDLFIEDIVNLGVMVPKDYLDKTTATVRTKYIDPAYFVASYSRANGFSKSPYMAHVEWVSIGDMRADGMGRDEVEKIIRYNRSTGNTQYNWNNDGALTGDKWWCDDFSVPVFCVEHKCEDKKYMQERTNASGQKIRSRAKYGKKSAEKITTQMLYSTKWVIGTDVVYDYGVADYTNRDHTGAVHFSYHPKAMVGKSFTELCEPIYDQVQMNWLKFQNALAKSPVKGVAIEIGALTNIALAGAKLRPDQLIQIRNIDGTLLYRGTGLRTTGNHHTGVPIKDMEGGMGAQLNEFITTNEWLVSQIREMTGITQAVAATGNQDHSGLGLSEMDAASTANVLKPMFKLYQTCKENVAKGMLMRFQLTIRQNKKMMKGYYPMVGKTSVTSIKILEGMDVARLGITIKASADARQRQEFLIAANESLKAGKNGQPGIQYSDFFFLKRLIDNGGSLTFAQTYLSYREQAVKDQMDREAKERMQIQNQGTMQVTEQKAQAELAKINAKAQADIATYEARRKADIEYERAVADLKPDNAPTLR